MGEIAAILRSAQDDGFQRKAAPSETEEFFAERVFVVALCFFGFVAGFFFLKVSGFLLVDFGDGVISGGQRLFVADGGDPCFYGCLVVGL